MNIIITGASSGVGFEAVFDLLADPKNQVIALARSEDKLARLASINEQLNPGSKLYPIAFDIYSGDYRNGLIPFVTQVFGKVDVLINNAGQLINKPFVELNQTDFEQMMQNNLFSHVKMIQSMLPHFSENAHIVNIGSMGGFQGSVKFPGLISYSASKAALHNLTECLAEELKDQKIKVNCLALGSAQTEMLEKAFPGYEAPVMAFEMGKYIADFALTGHKFFNGKIIPVATTTP
ncbi:SDR family NAD(P)-dependent oxidoreductase [Solitalea lacus]|uniref:SDR family NAD(P)-dependent oxidoreductase n=1 Tax=Solitalea lacus TaxID=2911172 RepID=UPI001ED9D2DC|nr:SDR family oxidoreductase [Solitalea lacus]UKJ08716.1 SDR family oxidoreductase [Solitalea lacus]